MLEQAPFFNDIVNEQFIPDTYWVNTEDNVRIRLSLWPIGEKGTILIFNGRTEYIEKYSDIAFTMGHHGYTIATNDWRGQGLSDRLTNNHHLCHVNDFHEYQLDVDAIMQALVQLGAPKPFYLVAHSMGGCVGLRALHRRIDVESTVFLGPMWRIFLNRIMRNVANVVTFSMTGIGLSKRYIIGTNHQNYLHFAKSEKNFLTSNLDTFEHLKSQIAIRPQLSLGGPSYGWLKAALHETAALVSAPPPNHPVLILLGSVERVVDPKAIRIISSQWPNAELKIISNGRHELLMEEENIRGLTIKIIVDFFQNRKL